MKSVRVVALSLLAGVLAGAAPSLAQEQPLVTGAEGVPVPKKTKDARPVYPAEALAQGLRGIVILDLLIDVQGHVASVAVIRSIPGLDAAAIAAARQWEYEPVRVAGKPVSLKHTVPITFTLTLPPLVRDPGIPELRQGVSPVFPAGTSGGGSAAAEVTLEGDGRVGAARVVEGNEPWAGALLTALQTWRFSPPPEDASVSFRVEATFAPPRGSEPRRVGLKATGMQRSDMLASAAPAAAPPPATPTQQTSPASPPPGAPAAQGSVPDTLTAPRTPAPSPGAAPPVAPPPVAPPPIAPPPIAARPVAPPSTDTPLGTPPPVTPGTAAVPAAPAADRTAPPPVEVITAAPPPQPPENGVSAIRDVALEPGVPDLTRGRRPVTPPLARMGGATGTVEVAFSVSAAGTTMVQNVSGPDLLKKAAEQAVASWVFRRTRADRAYLTVVFTYARDKTTALVRPQLAPAGAAATGAPASAPASPGATPTATPPTHPRT
jgi:TonB family protein